MRKFKRRIEVALLLALMAGLSLAVWAGPVLPSAPKLPDQMLSLAAVQQVRIGIDLLPLPLKKMGITDESIRQRWREQLAEAGYKVVDPNDDAPKLNLRIMYVTDPDVAGAIAYTCVLTVEQSARIGLAEEPLNVPTFLTAVMALETEEKVKRSIYRSARDVLLQFVDVQNRAAAARQRG